MPVEDMIGLAFLLATLLSPLGILFWMLKFRRPELDLGRAKLQIMAAQTHNPGVIRQVKDAAISAAFTNLTGPQYGAFLALFHSRVEYAASAEQVVDAFNKTVKEVRKNA